MSHLAVYPVALAMLTAIVAVSCEAWLERGGAERSRILGATRAISWLGLLGQSVIAASMLIQADASEAIVYRLGNWPSPYAIVLVLDRMSALMIAMTIVLAIFVMLAVQTGFENKGRYFHALLHLQLMGLCGAFLTGDLFNLFVFFEILLIASYGLLLFGGGRERLSAAFQYIVLNLVGSALFLLAVGALYGVLGTLNMADVGRAAAAAAPGDRPILQASALLLVMVFALKGALAPIHLWLPRTYAAATAPVAALFAVMTKVGIYAIARIVPISFAPLFFPEGELPVLGLLSQWLVPAALLTLVLATLGAAATSHLKQFVCFLILMSAGTAMLAVSLFTPAGYAAAIYYMVHSTFVLGAFFLLADLVARARGPMGDRFGSGPLVAYSKRLSVLFLVLAAAAVGLPPFSGFIGKLMVLGAAWELTPVRSQIWTVVIASSFLVLVVASRVGSVLFWNVGSKAPEPAAEETARILGTKGETDHGLRDAHFLPLYGLLAVAIAVAVFVEPIGRYARATAEQLLDRDTYIERVMFDRTPTPKTMEVVEP
jgi:multicomponent K+:H+ antiporter subunit D